MKLVSRLLLTSALVSLGQVYGSGDDAVVLHESQKAPARKRFEEGAYFKAAGSRPFSGGNQLVFVTPQIVAHLNRHVVLFRSVTDGAIAGKMMFKAAVNDIAVHVDGNDNFTLAADQENKVGIYRGQLLTDGKITVEKIKEVEVDKTSNNPLFNYGMAMFSPSGMLITAGNNTVTIWDKNYCIARQTAHKRAILPVMQVTSKNELIVHGFPIQKCDLTEIEKNPLEVGGTPDHWDRYKLYNPQGTHYAYIKHNSAEVDLYETASGNRSKLICRLGHPNPQPAYLFTSGTGVRAAAYAPNGKLLAVAYSDGLIRVWSAGKRYSLVDSLDATGKTHINNGGIAQIVWSPDGKKLVAYNRGGLIMSWDLLAEKSQQAGTDSILPK